MPSKPLALVPLVLLALVDACSRPETMEDPSPVTDEVYTTSGGEAPPAAGAPATGE